MEDNESIDIATVGLAGYLLQLFIHHFPIRQDGEKTVPTGKQSGAFVVLPQRENVTPFAMRKCHPPSSRAVRWNEIGFAVIGMQGISPFWG